MLHAVHDLVDVSTMQHTVQQRLRNGLRSRQNAAHHALSAERVMKFQNLVLSSGLTICKQRNNKWLLQIFEKCESLNFKRRMTFNWHVGFRLEGDGIGGG